MLNYTVHAITVKDASRFLYDLYSAIGVNMLKYNHDSSATIRLLSSLTDTSNSVIEDLVYVPNFTLTGLEFISIDRITGFSIASITSFSEENKEDRVLIGYSRYSDSYHILKKVDKDSDFIRHSIPSEAFFSDIVHVNDPVEITLVPNKKTQVGLAVSNSVVSLSPIYGFANYAKLEIDTPISIKIFGRDMHNEEVTENINIVTSTDHNSIGEYSFIDAVMLLNSTSNVVIKIHPFITGDEVLWDKMIVTREEQDPIPTIITVDRESKQLVFNTISTDITKYPLDYEKFKTVDLDIPVNAEIQSSYIDVGNRLLYITAVEDATTEVTTTQQVSELKFNTFWSGMGVYFNGWWYGQYESEVKFRVDIKPLAETSYGNSRMTYTRGYGNMACNHIYVYKNKDMDAYPHSALITAAAGLNSTYLPLATQNEYTKNYNIRPGDQFTWNGTVHTVDSIDYIGSASERAIFYPKLSALMPAGTVLTIAQNPDNYPAIPGTRIYFVFQNGSQFTVTPMPHEGFLVLGDPGDGDHYTKVYDIDRNLIYESTPGVFIDNSGAHYDIAVYNSKQGSIESNFDQYYFDYLHWNVQPVTYDNWTDWDWPFPADWNDEFDWPYIYGLDDVSGEIEALPMYNGSGVLQCVSTGIATTVTTEGVSNNLFCYPLWIPCTYTKQLDELKTPYQAMRIEYIEDCQNEVFTFWVYPSSKTNDIELMTIYINGVVYQEDILLELLREEIQTNRFDIPFAEIFKDGETALLEFKSYGQAESISPVWLDRTKLKSLYCKTVIGTEPFKSEPAQVNFVTPSISSTIQSYRAHGAYAYGEGKYGGLTDTDRVFGYGGYFNKNTKKLFKLSNIGNILVDGIKIVNVFDTFFYDEDSKLIITSDTITHIKSGDPTYSPPVKDKIIVEKLFVYYGISTEEDYSNLNLDSLNKDLIFSKPTREFKFNTEGGRHIWILYPKKYTEATLYFSGLEVTFPMQEVTINETVYLAYRSAYKQYNNDISITLE